MSDRQNGDAVTAKLKIGLTVSGAVSLGAYEGGALAALLVALEDLREHVIIDAIAGASAGAITGLVTARCLALGADPVQSMTATWVDLPDIDNLATHHEDSPLSSQRLAEAAKTILGDDGPPPGLQPQAEAVRLTMAMCSLAGLGYRIAVVTDEPPVEAVTYLDWSEASFDSSSTPADFVRAAPRALASGANPVGFPPALVTRSLRELEIMRAAGVVDPEHLVSSWYTDGGTLDNEPFGRLLDTIGSHADDDGHRILLLVHPIPTVCPGPSDWTDPHHQPRWPRTGLRAKTLQGDQTIYEDLRTLSKVNTRLHWVDQVVDAIAELLDDPDPSTAEASSGAVQAGLQELISTLDAEHGALNEELGRQPSRRPAVEGPDVRALLRAAIHRATGLSGKKPAVVEIVSPALDPSGKSAADLLAGERLGHFFGFLDVRFRRSDFALGYRNMQQWLTTRFDATLGRIGVPDVDRSTAWDHVQSSYNKLGWDNERHGDADFHDLSGGERLRLIGLGAHVAHITGRDLRHWSEGLPVDIRGGGQ